MKKFFSCTNVGLLVLLVAGSCQAMDETWGRTTDAVWRRGRENELLGESRRLETAKERLEHEVRDLEEDLQRMQQQLEERRKELAEVSTQAEAAERRTDAIFDRYRG